MCFTEQDRIPQSVLSTLKKLKSGYINGTRVALGRLEDFLSTSCVSSLSFLGNPEEGDPDGLSSSVKEYLEKELQRPFVPVKVHISASRISSIKRKQSITRGRRSGVSGIIKRTRSIQVDQYDPGQLFKTYFHSYFQCHLIKFRNIPRLSFTIPFSIRLNTSLFFLFSLMICNFVCLSLKFPLYSWISSHLVLLSLNQQPY